MGRTFYYKKHCITGDNTRIVQSTDIEGNHNSTFSKAPPMNFFREEIADKVSVESHLHVATANRPLLINPVEKEDICRFSLNLL